MTSRSSLAMNVRHVSRSAMARGKRDSERWGPCEAATFIGYPHALAVVACDRLGRWRANGLAVLCDDCYVSLLFLYMELEEACNEP